MGRSTLYGNSTQEGTPIACLGHPPHPAQIEDVICRICGHLIVSAKLGHYQIQQLLGSSRNGSTYLTMHLRSRQPVVLKLSPPDPACTGLWESARREIKIITALRHPSILPVFDCTIWQAEAKQDATKHFRELIVAHIGPDTRLLTLCQYIPGNLNQLLAHYERHEILLALRKQGTLPLVPLVKLIQQIGTALSAAHAKGIMHGALVPGNILVDGQENIRIADFGLARLHPPSAPYLAPELHPVCSKAIKTTNMRPCWLAVTPASDQYALAILCQEIFERLLRPIDYEHLRPVLRCATHPQPTQRFLNVDLFVQELIQTAKITAMPATSYQSMTMDHTPSNLSPRTPLHSRNYPQPTQIEQERYNKTANYNLAATLPQAPPSPADEWEKFGGILFTQRDFEGAVKAYERAVQVDARRSNIWLALGDAYFALEQHREALRAYEQATILSPHDHQAWSSRATALDVLGHQQEARECYERADQLDV